MERINPTESQWLELDGAATNIAESIQQKLPFDWRPGVGDIKSKVYDSYVRTLNSYDPAKNTSLVAYCLMFAKNSAYSQLITEYKRLKRQDTLYAIGEADDGDDDEYCPHAHGVAEVPHNTQFPMKEVENTDLVRRIYDGCDDVELRHAMACMYFLGYNLTDAAKECRMSKQLLLHKLRALGKKAI